MFFAALLMGELSDRYDHLRIVLPCVLGLAAGSVPMAPGVRHVSVALQLTGRGLTGLMVGCLDIAQVAITALSTPENAAEQPEPRARMAVLGPLFVMRLLLIGRAGFLLSFVMMVVLRAQAGRSARGRAVVAGCAQVGPILSDVVLRAAVARSRAARHWRLAVMAGPLPAATASVPHAAATALPGRRSVRCANLE
nr:hypothetical protein [Burkholderia ambifaria]